MDAGAPTVDPASVARSLRRAHQAVLGRIADACARSGRDPGSVTLVAVSKTVSLERLRLAVEVGIVTLGENRVQEAATKIPALPGASWHLVGPLQANKARRAIELFDVVETVDSVDLARRLDRVIGETGRDHPLPVLLQVNVDRDPGKAGVSPDALDDVLETVLPLPNLDLRGLMTIGRLVSSAEEARPTFRLLRRISTDLRNRFPSLGPELSMGMTDDFEVAIEEGATLVRVGRAIFGDRPPAAR